MTSEDRGLKNLADAIETALGLRLDAQTIRKANIQPNDLCIMAVAIESYYSSYQLPPKPTEHLRPYISPGLTMAEGFGLEYVRYDSASGSNHFHAALGDRFTHNVKRHLLYCHSLCIEDPLPYLLDYFRLNQLGQEAKQRLPILQQLLYDYAEMAPLLRNGLLIPIASQTHGGSLNLSDLTLSPASQAELLDILPELEPGSLGILYSEIRRQEIVGQAMDNGVDMVFPHSDFVRVLKAILQLAEAKFGSRGIEEPFRVGLLGNVQTINPDRISLVDIIRLRTDDELFESFRHTLGEILSELYQKQGSFTDLEKEFAVAARDRLASWRSMFEAKRRQSSFLAKLDVGAERILLGVLAGGLKGALLGAASGDPHRIPGTALGAAAIDAVKPGVELIRGIVGAMCAKPLTTSLRRHFLALGLEEQQLP